MIRYCYGKSRKRLYIAHEIQGRSMKKNLMNYLYVLLFVVTAIELNARSYYFKSYEVEDGLSNNNVTCFVQDHYGFMWFGTRDGLNRFDGNKFHIIKNQTKQRGTLISSWITDLAISPSGELWVGTNMGVQKYDYQTDTFSLIKFTKGIGCTYLEFDHQGNLWMLLSGFSLIKYNEQSELHQNYLYKDSDPITSFYITPQDQIWATTLNGNVVLLDPTDNKFIPLNIHNGSDTLHIDNMTTLWASPSDNTLLIGTSDNGVKQVNIQTGVCRNVLTQQKNSPLYTRDIFQVTNDEVWIATYNGIYIYQIPSNKTFHIEQDKCDPYSLSNNAIKQFCKDREGGLWICTDNGGINYLPPYLKFKKDYNIPGQKTINGDIIHDICQDANHNIWIGTEDAGLNKLDIRTQTYKNFQDKDGLSQSCIHGLTVIGDYLWIGTHANGVDVMDIRTEKIIKHESRPTVLVVEDNTEMLHFIGQEINVHYNVVTAGNGEEAIARLQEYGIQLIISDIMMPVMDGFTLLKKIKTNLEFSHIPIILLTAKNTLQSRMEGLELGADAYIDKPFSMDLLLTQVTNLLNNRSNMRAYYFNSPIANIKSMAYTKADEKFLKKLNDIIDSHINDVNLDVDMIADLMNLSRPTLYRKINGLSNVTPNELIKISRLKKAAELILQGDMRIYEIAEAVGFNSQSYFSRAFSKQFNMSPSQYAKENNIELK